jgi:hypothetical protein
MAPAAAATPAPKVTPTPLANKATPGKFSVTIPGQGTAYFNTKKELDAFKAQHKL